MNNFQKILESLVKEKTYARTSKHGDGRITKNGVKRWKLLARRRMLRKLNK